jgi:hypothetical protein
VVVPLTLLEHALGDWVHRHGQQLEDQAASTSLWAQATVWLLAALAGLLLYQVLSGAITRAIAAEVAGQDPGVEQSDRFGFARLGSILVVSILVGLATLAGLIVLIIPGIYIGVRLAVSTQALVVAAAVATTVTLPYGALVGVLLYLDLRAHKERLDLDTLNTDLQTSAA